MSRFHTIQRVRRPGAVVAAATAVLLFALMGCRSSTQPSEAEARIEAMYVDYAREFPGVPTVKATEARELVDRHAAVLVDVRSPAEQAVSMLPGAVAVKEFEKDPAAFSNRIVITYCTIGARSGTYAQELRRQGYDARNLRGSILAWTHAGLPLVTPDGAPTRRVHVYGKRWNLAADGYETTW